MEMMCDQGLLMTAYMKWRGLPETVLSLYRGAGALSGIASTFIFPKLQENLGAHLTTSFYTPCAFYTHSPYWWDMRIYMPVKCSAR